MIKESGAVSLLCLQKILNVKHKNKTPSYLFMKVYIYLRVFVCLKIYRFFFNVTAVC